MQCDDVKRRILAGDPLDAELRGHATSCPECREEVGFVAQMTLPEPPPSLRGRVLSAIPATRTVWRIPAVAAAVALALGLGFLAGRAFQAPPRVEVRTVTVEKPVDRIVEVVKPVDDREVFALAVSLQTVYGKQVNCEFDGLQCRKITADSSVKKMIPYCPLAQGLDRVAKERPDLVVFR